MGDNGHKLAATYAMKDLSIAMQIPQDWQSYVIEHSVDPDYRKRDDKKEAPKHFIDIDYYKEYLEGKMIQNLDSLKMVYADTTISKQGMLPWAIEVTYHKLVKAFKDKDKKDILLYMSDIAHYVGDANQPQHTTENYNGQLTGQKGIHFRYEIEAIDSNLVEIKNNFERALPFKIDRIRQFAFSVIYRTNTYNDLIMSADKYALKYNGTGSYDSRYKKLMWYRLKYLSIDLLNVAGRDIASVIYSAYVDSGSPELKDIK